MCLQCMTESKYIFKEDAPKFLGDYILMIATKSHAIYNEFWDKGQIGFVEINDPDFVVDWLKIFPDKLNMTYEEMENDDDINVFANEFRFTFTQYVPIGFWIVKCAIEKGFDYENQDLILWLIHRFHQFYSYMEDCVKELVTVEK